MRFLSVNGIKNLSFLSVGVTEAKENHNTNHDIIRCYNCRSSKVPLATADDIAFRPQGISCWSRREPVITWELSRGHRIPMGCPGMGTSDSDHLPNHQWGAEDES